MAIGSHAIALTVDDGHYRSAPGAVTVVVRDTTPPRLSRLPGELTLEATGPAGAQAWWTPPAALDIVDGAVPVVCVPPSGSIAPIGRTLVNCSASDAHGNVGAAAFGVTVRDTAPPVVQITSPPPRALLATSPATVTVQAADVGGVSSVTVNGVAAALTTGTSQAGTWTASVPITIEGGGTTIPFRAVATDASGNATGAMLAVDADSIPYALYEPRSHAAAVSVNVDPSGAMRVSQGDASFVVRSYFSRPGGGMLYLGDAPAGPSSEAWKVSVVGGRDQYMVIGSNASYSLIRTITVHPNRIEVSDTFRNLSTELRGVRFGNEIVAPDAATALVAGVPADQAGSSLNVPERPFVQVMKPGVSLGMVARDDAYRNQSVAYYTPVNGSYGIKDDNLGLAGGGSYTTRWELYPTDSSDPFDFYNAVRAEWGTANATVPGLFAFIYPQRKWTKIGKTLEHMTVADMAAWLDTTGIQTVCFAVHDDLDGQNIEAFGSRYLVSDASKAYWRPIVQRLRQAKPDLKVAVYFHMGLDVPNDPEASSSRMILLSGLQKAFTNSRDITRWYYYPATAGAFAARMRRVFDAVLFDFDTDAFYWDEYSYGNKSEYLDGAEWDGISVVVNPANNSVSSQVTLSSMATRALREQWTKELVDRGMTVWTNWQPTTEVDTARNQPHFLEHFSSGTAARGYLASPIQLDADSHPTSNADVLAGIHKSLEAGLLYAHIGASAYAEASPSILKHFYPITPKELHAGYVIGRERIVTSVTGAFGFGDGRTLTAFIYDQAGRLKPDAGRLVIANGRTYQLVELGAGEVAVIE